MRQTKHDNCSCSPYGDDETRSKEVSKIIEEFIESQWAVTGVASTDVAFGRYGSELLQTGKDITLRTYSIFEDVKRMTVNGSRSEDPGNDSGGHLCAEQ